MCALPPFAPAGKGPSPARSTAPPCWDLRGKRPTEAPKTAGPGRAGLPRPTPNSRRLRLGERDTKGGAFEPGAQGAPRSSPRSQSSSPTTGLPRPPRPPNRELGKHPATESRLATLTPTRARNTGRGRPSPANTRGRPVTSPGRDTWRKVPRRRVPGGSAPGPARPGHGRQPRSGTRKKQAGTVARHRRADAGPVRPDAERPSPGSSSAGVPVRSTRSRAA